MANRNRHDPAVPILYRKKLSVHKDVNWDIKDKNAHFAIVAIEG